MRSVDLRNKSKDEIRDLDVDQVSCYNVEGLKNYIIPSGFPLSKVNEDGKTLLHICVERAEVSHVKYLLDAGAPLGVVDHIGKSPVDYLSDILERGGLTPYKRSKYKKIQRLINKIN